MEWETIDADQINDIMEGRPPRPPKDNVTPTSTRPDNNSPGAAPNAPAPA
jgi:cell division protease FtsH